MMLKPKFKTLKIKITEKTRKNLQEIPKNHLVILKMRRRRQQMQVSLQNPKSLKAQRRSRRISKTIKKKWLSLRRRKSLSKWRIKYVDPWTLHLKKHRIVLIVKQKIPSAASRSKILWLNSSRQAIVMCSSILLLKLARTVTTWVGVHQANLTVQANFRAKSSGTSRRRKS